MNLTWLLKLPGRLTCWQQGEAEKKHDLCLNSLKKRKNGIREARDQVSLVDLCSYFGLNSWFISSCRRGSDHTHHQNLICGKLDLGHFSTGKKWDTEHCYGSTLWVRLVRHFYLYIKILVSVTLILGAALVLRGFQEAEIFLFSVTRPPLANQMSDQSWTLDTDTLAWATPAASKTNNTEAKSEIKQE